MRNRRSDRDSAHTEASQTCWPAVIAAIAAGVVGGLAFGKLSPALPLLKQDFGLSLIQTGWLVSSFNGLAAASAIFFGVLADRAGALRFCLGGLLAIAAGSVLGALAPSAGALIAARLVEGSGFIAVVVAAPALITAAAAPADRGIAFGLWSGYLPFGVTLGLLANPLLPTGFGWRSLWWLSAAAALACAAALALQSRHYRSVSGGARRSLASLRVSLSQPVVWLLGVAFAAYAIQHHALMVWLPTYLLETRGIAGAPADFATALAVFVNCLGNLLGGWLIQKNVARGRIIVGTFTVTTLVFLAVFSPALPDALRYALAVFYSFITGTVPAAVLSAGARYARSAAEVGAIQGLIVHVTNAGIFLGPLLITRAVAAGGSWDATLWVMLGCAAVALACGAAVIRLERTARAA